MKLGFMYWYIAAVTTAGSITDIRKKSVPVWFLFGMAAGVIPIALFERNIPLMARAFGFSVGALFLLVSVLSKEAVGKGDAILIGISGAALGFSAISVILCISFFLLSVISLGLLVIKRLGRKDRIPFFPFLAAGEYVLAGILLCR